MKTQNIMLTIAFSFISLLTLAQTKTETIKVYGNCEMCKNKIENAAKTAGAQTADWNSETMILAVSYNEANSSSLSIQKSIASAGYDTQDVKAQEDAYNKLHECCRYDRSHASVQSSMQTQDKNMQCCKKMTMKECKEAECCKEDMSCCNKHEEDKDCCTKGKM